MQALRFILLTVAGVVLFGAAAFFVPHTAPQYVSSSTATNLQSIFANMCASFLFLLTLDIGRHAQDHFRSGKFRAFFGDLALSKSANLVCPDFTFSSHCLGLLGSLTSTQIFSKRSSQYPGTRFIEVPQIIASNDLKGMVIVATRMGQYMHDSPNTINDDHAVSDPHKSFISFGLTSNSFTDLYLNSHDPPLFKLENVDSDPIIIVECEGQTRTYGRTDKHQHGIVLRYRPDPGECPNRYWFICAGLAAAGTPAAAWRLVHSWPEYHRRFGNRDFLVVIRTTNDVNSYTNSREVCAVSR